MLNDIPLSLYVHIPWCIRKCPYCDFNSHRAGKKIPEQEYIHQLICDLQHDLARYEINPQKRMIQTIFIGGGTPSLFSASTIDKLIAQLNEHLVFSPDIEITMEANPGTVEQQKFRQFRKSGINRLSLGIQSFQDEKLQALGRIHSGDEAKKAIATAQDSGFDNVNLDLMHGLPNQSDADALSDLATAISFAPQHLSWYQLTLEPETVFAKYPPKLPIEETLENIQLAGEALLEKNDYHHYETSAYSKSAFQAKHNLNYWMFGDYLGIGAGAHSKITDAQQQKIYRSWKVKNPSDYLSTHTFIGGNHIVDPKELPLEFMMNALRLTQGVPLDLFTERTGLSQATIIIAVQKLQQQKLLEDSTYFLKTTSLGQRFLNDCLGAFS